MGAAEIVQASAGGRLDSVSVAAYRIPTEAPESDGTLAWDATTLISVHLAAAGSHGFGYSYASRRAALGVADVLTPAIERREAFDIPARWADMSRALRNVGRAGIGSMALAAVDTALWDLKAKRCGLSLAALLGVMREAIPVYGSGGLTSLTPGRVPPAPRPGGRSR